MRPFIPRLIAFAILVATLASAPPHARFVAAAIAAPLQGDVQWRDLPDAVQRVLIANGVGDDRAFAAWRDAVRRTNQERLRDGQTEHLVYYALQSTRFTTRPPIEPAVSAKAFIESLPPGERAAVTAIGRVGGASSRAMSRAGVPLVLASRVPADARERLLELARVLAGAAMPATATSPARPVGDGRLAYFRERVREYARVVPVTARSLEAELLDDYVRAMRFLYEKEFVASQTEESGTAVAALYRTRGLSSDTAIEAGYGVYSALATLKSLQPPPRRRITRVLIVGPGVDLAPRTGFLEEAEPQSYQPFAVADALLALRLSDRATLRIDAVDLNPFVIRTIQRAAQTPRLGLIVASDIAADPRIRLNDDYRAYVRTFGREIGADIGPAGAPAGVAVPPAPASSGPDSRPPVPRPGSAPAASSPPGSPARHPAEEPASSRPPPARTVLVIAPEVQAMLSARPLDLVADRLDGGPYDLVIVTNVFPYLSDPELAVALANIHAALAVGGHLIHNERRELLLSTTTAIGLPAIQARTVQIATVDGARDLYDAIWLHERR